MITGTAPLTVRFSAAGSYDPDGTIIQYLWTFGDGESATGPLVTHEYALAGTYNVQLTVTDNDGKTGTTPLTLSLIHI